MTFTAPTPLSVNRCCCPQPQRKDEGGRREERIFFALVFREGGLFFSILDILTFNTLHVPS